MLLAAPQPCVLQIVFAARGNNLFFSAEPERWIAEADCVFVAVNTPTKTRGIGAGKAADLTFWDSAARMIGSAARASLIVVEKSTVPVRTADAMGKVRAALLCCCDQRWCPAWDLYRYQQCQVHSAAISQPVLLRFLLKW